MNTYQGKIGYARTSTTDQNLDAQIAALKAAGCGKTGTEQKSGASLEGRPELRTILDFIHSGEMLVVTRIDRLARSLSDLQTIVAQLNSKGAHLAATEQPVDTSNATGKTFFDMHGALLQHSGEIDERDVVRMARDIGHDTERFRADLWSNEA